MCGIAGVVDLTGGSIDLSPLLATLVHRGPDSLGSFVRGAGGIGQARLAVMDVEHGNPPLLDCGGEVAAVLNGEVYGFRAIGEALRADGHQLRSACDTEVIAHLAEHCEPADLARALDGMFAFAVWDARRQRLVLGRDRLGKKPLHWWSDGRRLVFGSEIKAVLAHPAVPRRMDPAALAPYLAYGAVPTPGTFYEGISSLPPGHVLTFGAGVPLTVEPYWEPPTPGVDGVEVLDLGFDEAAREVRRLLEAAVARRLAADVPLGAFLSGGIDSSAVVGLMAQHGPVRTFTIGFEDAEGFDERPFAREVARRHGTDHVELVVAPQAADLLETLVDHHDQPFGDSSALPTYLLSQLAREHVTVALSGDGGDELFGGYERFSAGLLHERARLAPGRVRSAASALLAKVPQNVARGRARSLQRFLDASRMPLFDAFEGWVAYTPAAVREQLLGPGGTAGADRVHRGIWDASAGRPTVERLLDLNLRTYLLDDLLPKVDRMSMAHGLEVRSPLLDVDLLTLARRLPARHKTTVLHRKRVLRAAVADLLPPGLLGRRKRGFAIPLDRWCREDLAPMVAARLSDPGARVRAHLDGRAIDDLVAAHGRGASHGHTIWSLLTLELWLRREEA